MKTYIYILLVLIFIGCSNDGKNSQLEQEEEVVLTKEEKLIQLYNTTLVPLFSRYEALEIPSEFQIIEQDLGVNAGAAFGYVEVSRGLVNCTEESIQLFALTHEVAHIATLHQASLFNLEGFLSEGPQLNAYKKAEYLADLIAVHLIKSKAPLFFEDLKSNFHILKLILGSETFTHPSGTDRIKQINKYINLSTTKTNNIAFKELYLNIWNNSI
ncbi:M48 family metalloprotease [Maribacter ulvicola]|uniref:Peptidase family M48 n=1 Tax=Maribacter ulvicola TaxID=228959 RepID=A0A1N6PDD8_9FLAO|nr:hypothetical protein [Maribacter ulvicola]SIQ02246.1 hypothetical protein SAMN05421797_101387 [Maribacter ulvicola]